MRTNGTLQYGTFTGGGFNDDGEPITGTTSWSEAIPCSISAVTNNSKGRYEDGKFNQASYTVLVEKTDFPLDIKRVRLQRYGIDLGEFAVQGLPIPTSIDRIKIVV